MMKLFSAALVVSGLAFGAATVDKPAPAFETKDARGKVHTLKDHAGKWVVLEWYNKDCPYVKKHYGSKNMQTLQKKYTDKGVHWLTVISSKEGAQGYLSPSDAVANAASTGSAASAILLDPEGTMGKAYGATATPHMFVIDPKGTVVYAGAIDSDDSADPAAISMAKNYVTQALESAMSGKPVETKTTRAYGCGIKYKS